MGPRLGPISYVAGSRVEGWISTRRGQRVETEGGGRVSVAHEGSPRVEPHVHGGVLRQPALIMGVDAGVLSFSGGPQGGCDFAHFAPYVADNGEGVVLEGLVSEGVGVPAADKGILLLLLLCDHLHVRLKR